MQVSFPFKFGGGDFEQGRSENANDQIASRIANQRGKDKITRVKSKKKGKSAGPLDFRS